jgi:hypothetical protein
MCSSFPAFCVSCLSKLKEIRIASSDIVAVLLSVDATGSSPKFDLFKSFAFEILTQLASMEARRYYRGFYRRRKSPGHLSCSRLTLKLTYTVAPTSPTPSALLLNWIFWVT